jgi:uncharacterized protein (TIGR00251 family)
VGLPNLNLQAQGPDLLLPVLVRPGARRDEIVGVREGILTVAVSARPVEGKANAACRRLLADVLGLPVSRVEIIAGTNTRRKRIRLRDTDLRAVKARLAPFLQ